MFVQNAEGRGIDVAVATPFLQQDDREWIFGSPEVPDPPVNVVEPGSVSMLDLLMELGCFQSRGQCRKNWKGPWEIPPGFSEFIVGKMRKSLAIWNPTE